VNSSKEKVKTGLFGYDFVLEMNTKNMGNSLIFLSINHTTLSAKRCRYYRILKINFAVDFCFWIELRLDGTQLLGLGLIETPEVPNTIMVANSLRFPMVHNTAPSICDLRVTAVRNSTNLLNQNSGKTQPFGLNQDFDKISP
jgi:hypothetical protein